MTAGSGLRKHHVDFMIHKQQKWWRAHSVIVDYQKRCSALSIPPSTRLSAHSLALNGSLCVSCAGEECSRQSCSLLLLADATVILLPIGVTHSVPLVLQFPLFKMIGYTTQLIHLSCEILAAGAELVHLTFELKSLIGFVGIHEKGCTNCNSTSFQKW